MVVHVTELTHNSLLLKFFRLIPGCSGSVKEQIKKVRRISEKGWQLWKPKVRQFHSQQTCSILRLNVLNKRQFSRKFVEISPYLIRLIALQLLLVWNAHQSVFDVFCSWLIIWCLCSYCCCQSLLKSSSTKLKVTLKQVHGLGVLPRVTDNPDISTGYRTQHSFQFPMTTWAPQKKL